MGIYITFKTATKVKTIIYAKFPYRCHGDSRTVSILIDLEFLEVRQKVTEVVWVFVFSQAEIRLVTLTRQSQTKTGLVTVTV